MLLSLLLGFLVAPNALAADPIATQLRAEVEKARSNLGDLPAWQEEIFANEVVPSSGRFVRDYKTSGTKVSKVDVDLEGIKRYLSFSASQILKPDAKVVLFVRANSACADCGKELGAIRTNLKERLERRGLVVLPATADEMRHEPSEAYTKRNAAGWVVADVLGEDDPDHPGDSRYSLRLELHFPGTVASSVQKQMEILPSESLEVSMSRLAIDAILEVGAKVRRGFAAASVDSPGIELALDGVSRFDVITQVKSKLQAAMGSDYRVVEKRVERGRAALAILAVGDEKAARVVDQLRKIPFEGFSVQIVNVEEARIELRIVPATGKGEA